MSIFCPCRVITYDVRVFSKDGMGIHLTHGILPKKNGNQHMYNNNMYGPQLPERAKNSSKNIELLDNGEAIPRSTKKLLV